MKQSVSARHVTPLRGLVAIRSRDDIDPGSDLFSTHEGEMIRLTEGIGRTPLTALPDHVGVCEVVAVGPDVTRVKPGDVCLIDFYEVKQPVMIDGENVFLAPADAMRATVEPVSGAVHPLPEYIMTKHSPDRMTVAVKGSNRLPLTRSETTSGIPGKKIWSQAKQAEAPCFFITYEEVVEVGSACLDQGVQVGDLVMLVTDFAMKFRAMGENLRIGEPRLCVQAVVDDGEVFKDSLERDRQWEAEQRAKASGLIVLA